MGLPLQAGKLQKYISPWRMAQNLVVVGWWMMNMAVSAPEVKKILGLPITRQFDTVFLLLSFLHTAGLGSSVY